jgi:hypothetical protein
MTSPTFGPGAGNCDGGTGHGGSGPGNGKPRNGGDNTGGSGPCAPTTAAEPATAAAPATAQAAASGPGTINSRGNTGGSGLAPAAAAANRPRPHQSRIDGRSAGRGPAGTRHRPIGKRRFSERKLMIGGPLGLAGGKPQRSWANSWPSSVCRMTTAVSVGQISSRGSRFGGAWQAH